MATYINNVTLNGNASVTDGVLSGFGPNIYASTNKNINYTSTPWLIQIGLNYKSASNTQWIMSPNQTRGYGNILLGLSNIGTLMLWLGSNNSSWDICNGQTGATALVNDNYYLIRLEFTGTDYILSHSEDGINFINDVVVSSSTPIYQGLGLTLGVERCNSSNTNYLRGSINLKDCYINANGERWWNGVTTYYSLQINTTPADASVVVTQPSMDSYTYSITNHNATLSDDVLSNFYASGSSSSARYASASILHSYSIGSVSSFEIQFKVHTPSDLSGSQRVFNWNGGADSLDGPFFGIYKEYAALTFYNGSKYFDCVVIENPSPNTDYIFKFVLNGLTCKSYYKLVGDAEFTEGGTTNFSSANDIRFRTKDFAIGCRTYDMLNICYFKGSVDLSDSYIFINGVYEWGSYSKELGYEENSTVSYQVSKTGYISQSDTFNILEDTTLDITLQKQAVIKLGDLSISKCYVGSTQVDKIYLGENLIFSK